MTQNDNPAQEGRWASSRRQYRPGSKVFIVPDADSTRIFLGDSFFGEVRGNLLIKPIRGSRHILRKPPSIANDLEALNVAMELGAKYIVVIDSDTGKEYRSSLSQIFARGVIMDRGHGRQIRLAMEYWGNGRDQSADQLSFWELP